MSRRPARRPPRPSAPRTSRAAQRPIDTARQADYPFIVAWGRILGSYRYFIDAQVQRARETSAPPDAIYEIQEPGKKPSGTWRTYAEISRASLREQIRLMLPEPLATELLNPPKARPRRGKKTA